MLRANPIIASPSARQRHRVRVPQHERPAGLLLQAADVLADGRLLDAEPGGGAGEAAGLLDGEEGRRAAADRSQS